MKKIFVRMLAIAVMTAVSLSCQAENYNTDRAEELKQFYIKYRELFDNYVIWWQKTNEGNYVKSYCTPEFYSSLVNEQTNGGGLDFLTYDYLDTMIMSTMNITPSDDCYIMTFKADYIGKYNKRVIKDVTLQIHTENGLISNVEDVEK